MPRKNKVREMFDKIAPDYDRLNHIMSLNVDKIWRRRALRRVVDAPRLRILDLACGTGDFAIAQGRRMKDYPGGQVCGVDLSEGMLEIMRRKVAAAGMEDRISCRAGDGENLDFPDGSFDRVSIAFGIRNFEDRGRGLREMLRVLRPGGRLVILELSRPENRFVRSLYDLYFLKILPRIGGRVSGDKAAYAYLPASVVAFPGPAAFRKELSDAGFTDITHKALTFGICRLYCGTKPERPL